MPDNSNTHHQFNYVEISAKDIDEAKRFYSAAFGWQFNDYGPDYVGIRRMETEGECGGICRADEVRGGGPLVILFSDDLESSYESVKNAGGEISLEIIAFPGGRRFQFRDPSGNELAVWAEG